MYICICICIICLKILLFHCVAIVAFVCYFELCMSTIDHAKFGLRETFVFFTTELCRKGFISLMINYCVIFVAFTVSMNVKFVALSFHVQLQILCAQNKLNFWYFDCPYLAFLHPGCSFKSCFMYCTVGLLTDSAVVDAGMYLFQSTYLCVCIYTCVYLCSTCFCVNKKLHMYVNLLRIKILLRDFDTFDKYS